ncbi:unnamed protein product, partial [Fusarium fujikuroi]
MPTCGNLLWCGVYTRLGCWVILTKNDEFAQVPDAPKPCFGVGQRSVYSVASILFYILHFEILYHSRLYGGWLQVPVSLPRTLAVCRGSRLK